MAEMKKIVVSGDVTVDWLMRRVKAQDPVDEQGEVRLNWELFCGTRMTARAGGALLLARLIQEAGKFQVLAPRLRNLKNVPHHQILHSMVLLERFPYSPDPEDNKDKGEKVFRVKEGLGYAGPEKGRPRLLGVEKEEAGINLVVIDDAGNGFRDAEEVWPLAIRTPDWKPLVILKMSRPLQTGALWDRLVRDHGDHLVVVINADDLRAMEGVNISRQLSWERTAMELVWQLHKNHSLRSLKGCRNLIVRFGLDGAVHYAGGPDGAPAKLYYDPLLVEGGFQDAMVSGRMTGTSTAFVAALTARIAARGLGGLGEGVRQGILSSRRLLKLGFGKDPGKLDHPGAPIFQALPEEEKKNGKGKPPESAIQVVAIPSPGPPECLEPSYWTILGRTAQERLEEVAGNYVRHGKDPILYPVPVGRFGKLKTMDRAEIESLQSIKNLLHEYLQKSHPERPLSVAVFGQPGSGKSFTVTQVAESVAGKIIQRREFNLSQWESAHDLIRALHQVRDEALRGKVPLVFFDEFDSRCGLEELGWLKYFLEPMQDGTFKEGEITHPIGKAIFVFAGGTSRTLQEFCREELAENAFSREEMARKLKESKESFRTAKGPDFVSRLKGYVNIPGLNPGSNSDDRLYLVRRALLLRSLLERKAKNLFDSQGNLQIDRGVLEAFLKVYQYKHGARSLEAVLDMSTLSGRESFEAAALPPAEQLRLHVDAVQFCRLLVQEAVFDSMIEPLARAIHEKFVQEQKGKKPDTDANMQPWEKLREDTREENRKQARDIKGKLQAVNCGVIPAGEGKVTLFEFTLEEIELMAIMEHNRFMQSKLDAAWTYAPGKRNDKKKTHPCLLPWEQLKNEEQEKDRQAMRELPKLLADIGFEIYSLVPAEARKTLEKKDKGENE